MATLFSELVSKRQNYAARPSGDLACLLLAALLLIVIFEFTSLDVILEDGFFQAGRFTGAGNWWLETFSHHWIKWAVIALALFIWGRLLFDWFWPTASLDRLRWIAVGVALVLAPVSVSSLKHFSSRHCPWDLQRYGGIEPYVGLFEKPATQKPGRCFPAGHASTGFSLFALVLFWRGRSPRFARVAWWVAFAAGLLLGWGQQARGAHFLSHTLWSAWVCWAICLLVDHSLLRHARIPQSLTQWVRRVALQTSARN